MILSLKVAMDNLAPLRPSSKRKPSYFELISWTTVSYKVLAFWGIAVFVIIVVVLGFIFPEVPKAAMNAMSRVGQKIAGHTSGAGPSQAHFVYLDGSVRVRKNNSNTWIDAKYETPLEKGDVVQTTSEGMAKIVFTDGTNYTVKQDSLIVVEENSTNQNQTTSVAVKVTTGTVDLTTATYTIGSKSLVRVAGATAAMAPDSSARVKNDPVNDSHEILVKKGFGEITRGNEIVKLADFEKVSFKSEEKQMTKARDFPPPFLISPSNMAPLFTGGSGSKIQFTWSKVNGAKAYRFRLSQSPYFGNLLADKELATPAIAVGDLPEGAYYWYVQAIDENGRESVESEKNRFTIVPRSTSKVMLPLEVQDLILHGRVVEVVGKTESSARVLVNGQEVPFLRSDGSFHYFTPSLPAGENVITITAQSAKGGVNTKQKTIIIQ